MAFDKNKLESSQVYPDVFGWSEGFRNPEGFRNNEPSPDRCLECMEILESCEDDYCSNCWELLNGEG